MKKINVILIYLISFIYMEIFYKLFIYKRLFSLANISMLIFLVAFSIILGILTTIFNKEKINKIIFIVAMSLIPLWFAAQLVVKDYFDFYISLSTFQVADQMVDFFDKVVIETLKRLPQIIMFYIPLIVSLIFNKYINFEKNSKYKSVGLICISLLIYGGYILSLNIKKDKAYSVYNLYYNINDISLNMENFGVLNSFVIDTKRAVLGFEEKLIISTEEENKNNDKETFKYEYNNLKIDFKKLISEEKNSTIKEMHQYFSNTSGTLKNEYTGVFKDKNLILFMAESFSDIAVNKELTPTLYKLVNSGFSFENFYTPTIYSTIGGEFQELTGIYAQSTSILSKFRSGDIYFPQGIGNVFKNINYTTYAYHNNSYSFQDRNKYLKSLGLDNFKACGNGLQKLIKCNEWPQSDVAMIEATYTDYIKDNNFMVFYSTVSGHASYTWGNASAKRHKEEYLSKGLDYSTAPASYLAAQMELDKALETLIKKLDEEGRLEDTVIALVGDHYPYELTINEINEISSYKKDETITVNKSNFILWNSEMDTVKVSKVGSQLDVMPTLYNVFGIDYDSRLFIGNDILSIEEGLAIFRDRSWVTDKGRYYARSGKFVPVNNEEIDEEYIQKINQIVNNKITMSKLIIENNYYKKVLD